MLPGAAYYPPGGAPAPLGCVYGCYYFLGVIKIGYQMFHVKCLVHHTLSMSTLQINCYHAMVTVKSHLDTAYANAQIESLSLEYRHTAYAV